GGLPWRSPGGAQRHRPGRTAARPAPARASPARTVGGSRRARRPRPGALGPGPRGDPHGHLGPDLPAHPRDRTVVRFDTPAPLLQVHLVRSGHAVAFVPGLIAAAHLGGTRPVRPPGDPHRSLYTAARAGAREHPALQAFRAALLEAADSLADLEGIDPLGG